MYDLDAYGDMIDDPVRMRAYSDALRGTVKPGCVVLDIGTGTGVHAMLACRLGARRVYAIEPSPVIQLAREFAVANGMAEAIEFHQGVSTGITLPERADVIVSDLRGVLPLHAGHLSAIIDARRRLLAPGGRLVPRLDRIRAAVVEAPELHRHVTVPWRENDLALEMGAAATLAANTWTKARVQPGQMLTAPADCGSIDYTSVDTADFRGEARLEAARSGQGHGFCLWFDAELAPGIGFSNAPGAERLIYGQAFFRWSRAVSLAAGDRIDLRLDARLLGDEYVWSWDSNVHGRDAARFRQSTFLGKPMTPESLHRKAEGHVARLTEDGEVDRAILERMARRLPLGDIARELAALFPQRFGDWREALRRVGDLSSRYGA